MLYCMLYLLMLIVVTFDKVEAIRMLEQREAAQNPVERPHLPPLMRLANGFNRIPELWGRARDPVPQVDDAANL